jgi:hypothetical protein
MGRGSVPLAILPTREVPMLLVVHSFLHPSHPLHAARNPRRQTAWHVGALQM